MLARRKEFAPVSSDRAKPLLDNPDDAPLAEVMDAVADRSPVDAQAFGDLHAGESVRIRR